MTTQDSATRLAAPAVSPGLGWGLLGVLAFSLSLPLTRVAVGGLSPLFVGAGRSVLAAVLAAAALAAARQRLPRGAQWARLAVVGGGVVLGFPLLTSYALQTAPASHGAVVIALLPAATASVIVLRTREHPPRVFWVAAGLGAVAALGFASLSGTGLGVLTGSDVLLLLAVLAAAVGYAEGGLLSRQLGAWQTVSWALVLCAPVTIALTVASGGPGQASFAQWSCLVYLGVVSSFLGFFAWYRGLALGPMAQVSQVQLVQPVLSIGWAAWLLGERITGTTALGALAVVACAATAVRVRRAPGPARH